MPAGVDPTSAQIVARSDEDKSRVAALLATKGGPSPKRWQSAGILPAPAERPGGPAFDIKGTIDRMVLRCVAKIALNYTAYVAGPEFSLGPDFNAIRSFARHGASAGRPLVIPSSPPGLIVRPAATRRNVGHTLGITWTDDSRHLACEASFFDAFIYTVALARDYQGVWREVRSVHRFDLVTREAIELPPACYARL